MVDNTTVRINLILLITLILVGFSSSYSFSSKLNSPKLDLNDESISLSLNHHLDDMPETNIYRSRDPWRNLILKSLRIQPISPEEIFNQKRYASQAFHAMRG